MLEKSTEPSLKKSFVNLQKANGDTERLLCPGAPQGSAQFHTPPLTQESLTELQIRETDLRAFPPVSLRTDLGMKFFYLKRRYRCIGLYVHWAVSSSSVTPPLFVLCLLS